MLKKGILSVSIVVFFFAGCDRVVKQPGWLVITHNGVWERRVDITSWDTSRDVVKLGEFYYPWQGEDSIDYSLDNALHKVNGGNVGVNLSSCDEESLVISHPEDLITIRLDIKKNSTH